MSLPITKRDFLYRPPTNPISILHADTDILIVSKPAGLLSVPGKTEPDCLEARLRDQFSDSLTVHRLDMATSGLMVFARNKNAQRHLGLQFEKRVLKKTYIADVWGSLHPEKGTVDLPLICDWNHRPRQKVCFINGKTAQTEWEVMTRSERSTRVLLKPLTGRSHQLRVHMQSLGHPIWGDRIYAPDDAFYSADRLRLHALTLHLRHPTGGAWHKFTDPCPF